ncbi:hypothetical protein AQUCO_03200088v1 [Aquilegia coerulea]|uniref:Plastid lipid-associated protein/fibrillin conserved domain-containing protein n=1 Tax=Aquilegia coerulea TaxID=218851 RepID=A0A2G5D050_AQUCA|nr:hypothetical protein AQUCO_03200088v1 [Aquilegia coerulea]
MAGVSTFNSFTCKTFSQLISKNSLSPINSFGIPTKKTNNFSRKSVSINGSNNNTNKAIFRTQAGVGDDDEWGTERPQVDGEVEGVKVKAAVAEAEPEPPKEPTEVDVLKKALIDSLYGTDRGLKASSETRAEIIELITQLEAKNPTPAPTEALTLLNGKWILAYTSFVGLFPLLARGTLPLVKVEEISQTINSVDFSVQNSVTFSGPLATTSLSTNAKFEVRSPTRVQRMWSF